MITAIFDEAAHQYTDPRNRAKVPSVTQILKGIGLIDDTHWSDHDRDRGSAVHKACELLDTVGLDWASVGWLEGYVRAWEAFKRDFRFEPILVEKRLIHPIYPYGGTLDRLGWVRIKGKGRAVLLDLKSGPVHDWTEIQLGGYEGLLAPAARRHLGLQLCKDGTYRPRWFDNVRAADLFYSCLAIYQWRQTHGA